MHLIESRCLNVFRRYFTTTNHWPSRCSLSGRRKWRNRCSLLSNGYDVFLRELWTAVSFLLALWVCIWSFFSKFCLFLHFRMWRASIMNWFWRGSTCSCGSSTQTTWKKGEWFVVGRTSKILSSTPLWHFFTGGKWILFQLGEWAQSCKTSLLETDGKGLECLDTGWYPEWPWSVVLLQLQL